MKQKVDLDGVRVFVAIAESLSFTAAAKTLGTSKSTISRRLESYETSIGVSLFRRSTRSISLTEVGKQHYLKVKDLIHGVENAIDEVTNLNQEPAGLLCLSGSFVGGQRLLMPHVWRFMEKYPKVKVDMRFTDEVVDVIAEGIDFTLRMGELQDSELLVRKLATGKLVVVASPEFLQKHSVPKSLAELKQLPAVITARNKTIWRFQSGESVSVNWVLNACGIPVAVDAALRGIGMTLVPHAYCQSHLDTGKLIALLPEEPLPEVDISLVYPRLRHQSPVARAFLEEIRKA